MYTRSIFWFRQDLRVHDNRGLDFALKNSQSLLPVFILDEHIIDTFGGLEDRKFGFIREALELLSSHIQKLGGKKVIVFHGKPEEILPYLIQTYAIESIFCNKSYSHSGQARDIHIQNICQSLSCDFHQTKDYLIAQGHEIEQRKVFSPYFKLWKKYIEKHPQSVEIRETQAGFEQIETREQSVARDFIRHPKHPFFTMDFGSNRLGSHITQNYDTHRNMLDYDGTSRLSPYLRFGIFSIREVYQKATGVSESFVSELAWRDFWWHIYHYFPESSHQEFQEKRRHIRWENDEHIFKKWCRGETGYPIVDAAMQQLNTTNWMHGRARMIVASFLTKDLHIDWRLGEKYFREKLLDYDCAVNLGNWQWSASVGADPKPLRIFNPTLQSQKFDPNAQYIKKYIPKLQSKDPIHLHDPLKYTLNNYHSPLVDHSRETKRAREAYKTPE